MNRKVATFWLLGLMLLGARGALAQEEDSTALFDELAAPPAPPADEGAAPEATERPFKARLSGTHEFAYHAPVQPASQDYEGEIKVPALRNLLGLEVQDGALKLVSEWHLDLLADPAKADAQGQRGDWNALTRLRPGENYLSWSGQALKLSAGYQIYSWGVADKLNPTDNLNPRDYTVGLNFDKIPVLSAAAVWYPSDTWSVEGVFIPYEQPERWPIDWAGRVPDGLFYGKSYTLATKTLEEVPHDRNVVGQPLAQGPKSLVAGARASYRSSAVDLSVSYLYDFDSFFTPRVITATEHITWTDSGLPTGQQFTRVEALVLERQRVHRFGADAKTTVGRLGLWAEAAWSLTQQGLDGEDRLGRRSKLDYVLGLDFNYGPNDSWYANLQYLGTWVPGYRKDFSQQYPGGLPEAGKVGDGGYMQTFYEAALVDRFGMYTEGLLQGLTSNLKWELWDGTLTPQFTAVYMLPFQYDDQAQTRYGSLSLNPELDYMPADSLHVKVGADLCYAWVKDPGGEVRLDTAEDRLGFYTPSNNVYLKVVYKWNHDLVR
jgi:hypothetical protein